MTVDQSVAQGLAPAQTEAVFARIVRDIRACGYCILPGALPGFLTRQLLEQVHAFDDKRFAAAGIGRQSDYIHEQKVRTDKIIWISQETPAGALWCQWTEQLRLALNRQLLLGLFSFESHFSHYAPGAYYARHLDAFKGERNRILSVVAYLNPDWGESDGGELVLYTGEDDRRGIKVRPQCGTLVVFLSEDFPHEVLPARRDRYAVAGWFRTNTSTARRADPPQ